MTNHKDDRRQIIIGDVHGCIDELKELMIKCNYGGPEKDRLIFVGDLVDKGPCSEEVVELAMLCHAECVLGNHDEKHLRWNNWTEKVSTGEAEKNPMKHNGCFWDFDMYQQNFFSSMPLYLELPGDWLVVHAGFEATGKAISTMHKNVMIRIRDVHVTTGKYLSTGDSAVRAEGAVRWPERWKDPRGVIYGHAPRYAVKRDFTPAGTSCLGIDTGCVFGGYLTAVIIDPSWLEVGRFEYVQVRAAKKYTEPYIEGEDYVKYAQPQDL